MAFARHPISDELPLILVMSSWLQDLKLYWILGFYSVYCLVFTLIPFDMQASKSYLPSKTLCFIRVIALSRAFASDLFFCSSGYGHQERGKRKEDHRVDRPGLVLDWWFMFLINYSHNLCTSILWFRKTIDFTRDWAVHQIIQSSLRNQYSEQAMGSPQTIYIALSSRSIFHMWGWPKHQSFLHAASYVWLTFVCSQESKISNFIETFYCASIQYSVVTSSVI